MHVLRCSLHTPPLRLDEIPTTVIVRDVDVTVTPEEWAAKMETDAAPIFVTTETFEMADGELHAAITEGMMRLQESERIEVERNMAVAYYYFTKELARMPQGSVISQSRPAPFGARDAETVLRQIKAHPAWKYHGVTIITDDHEFIALTREGSIKLGGTYR